MKTSGVNETKVAHAPRFRGGAGGADASAPVVVSRRPPRSALPGFSRRPTGMKIFAGAVGAGEIFEQILKIFLLIFQFLDHFCKNWSIKLQ